MREPASNQNPLPPGALVSLADVLHYIAQDGYLSRRSAAGFLGLSIRTLDQYREIPRYRIGGKILYRRSELVLWMEGHREPTQPQVAISKSARRARLDELRRRALEMTR